MVQCAPEALLRLAFLPTKQVIVPRSGAEWLTLDLGPRGLDSRLPTAMARRYEGMGMSCLNLYVVYPCRSLQGSPCSDARFALMSALSPSGTETDAVYLLFTEGESCA